MKIEKNTNGIINVNKPQGMTSHDVITKIKRHFNVAKIGHAGTLDPLATGVLIVLINQATKLSDYLMADYKKYHAEITLGIASDSEDITGAVIKTKKVEELINIDEVLNDFRGELWQIPPMYSSVRQNGKKLYELARKGMIVDRTPRKIIIRSIYRTDDITYINSTAKFCFLCEVSKGTYIRTLCTQIGEKLGYPALMSKLCRVQSGVFTLENSYSLEEILSGNFKIINMLDGFKNEHIIEVDEKMSEKIKNGISLELDLNVDQVVFSYNEQLLAIYQKEEQIYKAKRVWN